MKTPAAAAAAPPPTHTHTHTPLSNVPKLSVPSDTCS
jgi:hypothetical protein